MYKKFVGEYAAVNLSCSNGNPIPTLSAFGIISSVTSLGLPEPNWMVRVEREIKRSKSKREGGILNPRPLDYKAGVLPLCYKHCPTKK